MANYIDHLKPSMSGLRTEAEKRDMPPPRRRSGRYEWAAAPFPSATGEQDVTFAGFDVLVIPVGARHAKEAFEFIAYVNRQDVMEKLCSSHSKNSPLRKVSERFLREHPNPYVDVFERLAASPKAYQFPRCPIMPEVMDELKTVTEKVTLLKQTPREALAEAESRLQAKLDRFNERQKGRKSRLPASTVGTDCINEGLREGR